MILILDYMRDAFCLSPQDQRPRSSENREVLVRSTKYYTPVRVGKYRHRDEARGTCGCV